MGHVNLDALISDCKNASQCVQMLLPIEEDSLILVISTVVLFPSASKTKCNSKWCNILAEEWKN